MKNNLSMLVGAVALLAVGQASASTAWTLASNYGNISSGVTVSAYANTGGWDNAANTANNAALQTIQTANWNSSWGGITNTDTNCSGGRICDTNEGINPEHAIDNNQRYDMALLDFGSSSVKLSEFQLGWWSGDSDVTVMAYTGLDPFVASTKLVGSTYDQLVNLGWTVIGNYGNVAYNLQSTGASVFSSFWLIGAYNPLAAGASQGLGVGTDSIKLASVRGDVCVSGSGPSCSPPTTNDVPEPGSLVLFGVALLGLVGMRRCQAS
jgi:hypothetical protein